MLINSKNQLVNNFRRLKAAGVSKKISQEAAYLPLEVLLESPFRRIFLCPIRGGRKKKIDQ
jgi:hypothetical protein